MIKRDNDLIARTDSRHEQHERCLKWERSQAGVTMATCPLTENGFLRIYGHPKYPNGPGSPAEALIELCIIRRRVGHQFLHDDISIADTAYIVSLHSVSPKHLTDLYLLALAICHGFQFATMDESIPVDLISGGHQALSIVP